MTRIVVGISGASGAIYGIRFLELLRAIPGVESHLVISEAAKRTIAEETEWALRDVEALATRRYSDRDIGAAVVDQPDVRPGHRHADRGHLVAMKRNESHDR